MPDLSSYNREYRLGIESDGPVLHLEAQHHPRLPYSELVVAWDWQTNLNTMDSLEVGSVRYGRWLERWDSPAFKRRARVGTVECAMCGEVGDLNDRNLWLRQYPSVSSSVITCKSEECKYKATCFVCKKDIHTNRPGWDTRSLPPQLREEGNDNFAAFCTDCLQGSCFRGCTDCGLSWLADTEKMWSDLFTKLCIECEVPRKEACLRLAQWNTRYDALLPDMELVPGVPYLGVELEVEMMRGDGPVSRSLEEWALELSPMLDFKAFAKTDGTLTHGLEFVTKPMIYEEQAEFWPPVLAGLQGIGDPRRNCGVHIHISRWALSPIQLGKMLVFLNEPDNAELLQFVAGRGSTEFNRIQKKKYTDIFDDGQSRYETLNLTNEKTVEFRMFSSTVETKMMLSYLQFVSSMLTFTSPGNVGMTGLTKPRAYLDYVAKLGRGTYKELYSRLREGDWL